MTSTPELDKIRDWIECLSYALNLAGIEATQEQIRAVMCELTDEVTSTKSQNKWLEEETDRLREVLRQRNKMLPVYGIMLKTLKRAVKWLEQGELPPVPDHICGPESPCDCGCQNYTTLCEEIHKIKAIIAKAERVMK